jgi:hypothetical protein
MITGGVQESHGGISTAQGKYLRNRSIRKVGKLVAGGFESLIDPDLHSFCRNFPVQIRLKVPLEIFPGARVIPLIAIYDRGYDEGVVSNRLLRVILRSRENLCFAGGGLQQYRSQQADRYRPKEKTRTISRPRFF